MNNLPKTVTGQRHDCDLNPVPSANESSTLITRLPSHLWESAWNDINGLVTGQSIIVKTIVHTSGSVNSHLLIHHKPLNFVIYHEKQMLFQALFIGRGAHCRYSVVVVVVVVCVL